MEYFLFELLLVSSRHKGANPLRHEPLAEIVAGFQQGSIE
jgi:hypothetical protein